MPPVSYTHLDVYKRQIFSRLIDSRIYFLQQPVMNLLIKGFRILHMLPSLPVNHLHSFISYYPMRRQAQEKKYFILFSLSVYKKAGNDSFINESLPAFLVELVSGLEPLTC